MASQINVFPDSIDAYLATERNRQRHAAECQEQLGLRSFSKRAAAELIDALLPAAIEDDRLLHLATLAHLSPLGWKHINLTGDYIWLAANDMSENTDGLRALRPAPQVFKKAA